MVVPLLQSVMRLYLPKGRCAFGFAAGIGAETARLRVYNDKIRNDYTKLSCFRGERSGGGHDRRFLDPLDRRLSGARGGLGRVLGAGA